MKKPKIKNFLFKKGLKSYFHHLKKYDKQQQLREADKILSKAHNVQQSCDITPKYREYAKAIKVNDDGTIIYQIRKHYFKKKGRKK